MHETGTVRRAFQWTSLAVLCVAGPLVATAAADDASGGLDGWNGYNFGMTMADAVNANPGQPVPVRNAKGYSARAVIDNELYDVQIGVRGTPPDDRIYRIELSHLDRTPKKIDLSQCRDFVSGVVKSMEARYGELNRTGEQKALNGLFWGYNKKFSPGRAAPNGATLNVAASYVERCKIEVVYEAAAPRETITGKW